jgi:hypothetical protein
LVHRRAKSWTTAVLFAAWAINISPPHSVQTGSGAHPASYIIGTEGTVFPGVKLPGREADLSSPTLVLKSRKMELNLHVSWVFMAWFLILIN